MKTSVGFIGTGRIAVPMVESLVRRFPQVSILVSERSESVSTSLAQQFQQVSVCSNQALIDHSDIVFLSVLAEVARNILPSLQFRAEQSVISVMADISLIELGALITPATRLCVTIPLPFINTGDCPLPVYPDSSDLRELFGDENLIIPVETEAAISPHFAATAVLSTLLSQSHQVSQWLAGYSGDRVGAERYVALFLAGFLHSLPKDGEHRFEEALQELSTEGGLNTQLLAQLRDGGHFDQLKEGLETLQRRLENSAGARVH